MLYGACRVINVRYHITLLIKNVGGRRGF